MTSVGVGASFCKKKNKIHTMLLSCHYSLVLVSIKEKNNGFFLLASHEIIFHALLDDFSPDV
jgi:hypothetical protein